MNSNHSTTCPATPIRMFDTYAIDPRPAAWTALTLPPGVPVRTRHFIEGSAGNAFVAFQTLQSEDLTGLIDSFNGLHQELGPNNRECGRVALAKFLLNREDDLEWIPPVSPSGYHSLKSLSVELDPEAGGRFLTWPTMAPEIAMSHSLAGLVHQVRRLIPSDRLGREYIDVYQTRVHVRPGVPAWPSPLEIKGSGHFMALTLVNRSPAVEEGPCSLVNASGNSVEAKVTVRKALDTLAWDSRRLRRATDHFNLTAGTTATGVRDVLIMVFHQG
jgi:hypothetical protein